MFSPTNLCKSRHGIFYFRLRLPFKSIQQQPCYMKVSLATREPREALHLARMLEYHASRVLTDPRTAFMTNDEIKELVRRYCEAVLANRKKQIDELGPLADAEVLGLHKALEDHATLLALEGIDFDDSATMKAVMGATGVSFAAHSREYKLLQQNYRLAYPNAVQAIIQHNAEARNFDFTGHIVSSQSSTKLAHPKAGLTLRQLIDAYMNMMVAERRWTNTTRNALEAIYNLLAEIGSAGNALSSAIVVLSIARVFIVLSSIRIPWVWIASQPVRSGCSLSAS